MNHEQQQRATSLLLANYREDEVVSIITVEFQITDEFILEDLPHHVARINKQVTALGEVS